VISNETIAGGIALDLTVEAIERVGAETFIYGTRQHEVQGVAATPGELPPGEVIVRIPGAIGPAIGERIRAVAASDKLHLFTAHGRKRVGEGCRHSPVRNCASEGAKRTRNDSFLTFRGRFTQLSEALEPCSNHP